MSDTNRVSLGAVKEVTYAIIPATPVIQAIPIASTPNLAFVPETVVSDLLRSDRQIDDLVLVGGSAGGDVNSELAYGIYDDFLEAAMFSTWQARRKFHNREAADQITSVDADSYTVTNEGAALIQRDLVFAEGFSTAANNGLKHVDTGATTTDVLVTETLVVEASPPEVAVVSHVGHQATNADVASTTSPDTLTSTTLDFTTLSLAVGDWVCLAGFTGANTGGNDYCRISAIAATVLTFDIVPATWAIEAVGTNDIQIFFGDRIINGTTESSYSLERVYNDHSPITYEYLRGMLVDGYTFTASPQAIVTQSITLLGANQFFSDSNDPATGTDGAGRWVGAVDKIAPTFEVYNSSSNVGRIARGGSVIAGSNFITEASVSIANNLREKKAVGVLGAADVGSGEFSVTGSLQAYFDDKSLAVDVVDNTESSFDIRFRDGTGRVFLADVPRLKFSEGAPEVSGKNEDVTIPLSYQGIRHATLGYTMKIIRFAYAPV